MNPGVKKTLNVARRTRKNLEFIIAAKKAGADVEEVTQLINSMQSMITCICEKYLKRDQIITWEQVQACGLQPIRINGDEPNTTYPNLKCSSTFDKVIRNLRNTFSHDNYELVGDPISGLKVWNLPPSKPDIPENRNWQAHISSEELKSIAFLLFDYIEKKHGSE